MNCPECNGKMTCIDTRQWRGGSTRRQYKCACGNRPTTIEQFARYSKGRHSSVTILDTANDSLERMILDMQSVLRKYSTKANEADDV
jgi:transcriptional regulator NrdR family protein